MIVRFICKIGIKNYNIYKTRAKQKGIEFNIRQNYFIYTSRKPCYICGHFEEDPTKYNGVDRINNNFGYVETNIASCCWTCNRAKNNMTLLEFEKWVSKLGWTSSDQFKKFKKISTLCDKYNTSDYEQARIDQLNSTLSYLGINEVVTKRVLQPYKWRRRPPAIESKSEISQ